MSKKVSYANAGNVIDISLEGDYKNFSILAIYMPITTMTTKEEITGETECEYGVQLWLKYKDIDDGLPINIQKISTEPIISTKSTIKKRIVKLIDGLCENGTVQKNIDRYNYYCRCFEIGNDLIERGEV